MKKTLVLIALLIPPAFAACIADGGPIVFDDGPVDSGAPDASPLPDAAPDAPQDAPSPLPDSGDAEDAALTDGSSDAAPDASDGAPPACAHDPCAGGGPLDPTCDPGVASVCVEDPDCCTDDWTMHDCGYEYDHTDTLGNPSANGGKCGLFAGDCKHSLCDVGGPLIGADGDACNLCVFLSCDAEMPSCCTAAWDADCVTLAQQVCAMAAPCP